MGIRRSCCVHHYGLTRTQVRIINFFHVGRSHFRICIMMYVFVFRNTPKTEEDWINLLQQQESLHNVEMRKWQRVLHTAAQLLRQVRLR
jgi:hypothetical protein